MQQITTFLGTTAEPRMVPKLPEDEAGNIFKLPYQVDGTKAKPRMVAKLPEDIGSRLKDFKNGMKWYQYHYQLIWTCCLVPKAKRWYLVNNIILRKTPNPSLISNFNCNQNKTVVTNDLYF